MLIQADTLFYLIFLLVETACNCFKLSVVFCWGKHNIYSLFRIQNVEMYLFGYYYKIIKSRNVFSPRLKLWHMIGFFAIQTFFSNFLLVYPIEKQRSLSLLLKVYSRQSGAEVGFSEDNKQVST